jgi:hypothetical protein
MHDAHSSHKRIATTDETELHWAGIVIHIRRGIGMVWEAKMGSTCERHSHRFASFFKFFRRSCLFRLSLFSGGGHFCARMSFALGQAISRTQQEFTSSAHNSVHVDREAGHRIGCWI